MIDVGIVGGHGYTGGELLRLLSRHPEARLAVVTSRSEAGKTIEETAMALRGVAEGVFAEPSEESLSECQVVFFATPSGVAMQMAPTLLEKGIRVIDLSADFRLKDAEEYEHWYGAKHTSPDWLAQAVYGLVEANRQEIAQAQLVANPGCYPTAVLLGLLPLLREQVADVQDIVVSALSGTTGAGKKADAALLYAEMAENLRAYSFHGHRHWPEIRQELANIAGQKVGLSFVPHLAPLSRGIHATIFVELLEAVDLHALFSETYREEPMVDVLPAGQAPDLASVRGSNLCRLGASLTHGKKRAVVLSVIDNLVKGAAGQAIQNMNVLFGLPETTGLQSPPLFP